MMSIIVAMKLDWFENKYEVHIYYLIFIKLGRDNISFGSTFFRFDIGIRVLKIF